MDTLEDPRLGPNLGRSKNDPHWDCIHVLAPGEQETTLCGHSLDEVAQACSMDTGWKPNEFNGCWTCLEKSNRWATRDQASPASEGKEEKKTGPKP